MVNAVEVFKRKAREWAQADLGAKAEQDRMAAEQRRADLVQLAGEFEDAVGRDINAVSSASLELEVSARSLTSVSAQ
ncbi:hypothetical protein [Bradyrhizobium sp. Ec3.3]|uniref:hypothetical protein n=1 Tax=Bradyrhizobium sp. Ec3.3 TaxID=189753 RepID=UPI00047FDD2D|nr:hypothetical protein [Bradyrhizobium sp. Ec3.3]